ncbi:MAG: MATE family efflux transporter [Deltaproteobacteria bacterium]|nr:MATE family efflux transporter [Deltaproteobacteria bacterium]
MKNIKQFILSKKSILVLIITMSLPAIGEMALNTMLGVSDTIMISRFIGKEALASVGFANQIVFTLIFIFAAFNTGAVALISRSFGEKNFKRLKEIAEQNVTLNLLIGLVILLLSIIFNHQIFRIFDVSKEIYLDTLKYFNIILVGFVPMFLCFSFAAILRGSGNTMTPMVITGIANVINIIGNYVLILGIGPFPQMGITGAAWATSGSRILALLIYIYVIYIKDSDIRLKFVLFVKKDIIRPLWNISLPGGIEQALMQLSFLVMAVIISKLDTVSEATFRILIQIESLSFMPAVGMSIATATLVGKSLGEKNTKKASEVGYLSIAIGLVWAIIIGSLFIFLPGGILSIFSKDQLIIQTGIFAMLFIGINQIGLNYNIIICGALRGAGDTKTVMINTVLRLWLIFVPFTYLFVIVLNKGLAGIWYAELLSFAVFGTQLFFRFKGRKWAKLKIDTPGVNMNKNLDQSLVDA